MVEIFHTHGDDQKSFFCLVSKPSGILGLALIFIFTKQLPAMVINAGLMSLIVYIASPPQQAAQITVIHHQSVSLLCWKCWINSHILSTHSNLPSHDATPVAAALCILAEVTNTLLPLKGGISSGMFESGFREFEARVALSWTCLVRRCFTIRILQEHMFTPAI